MFSNRFAFAALALACIAAAAAGGYLATRQNATSAVPVAAATPATPVGPETASGTKASSTQTAEAPAPATAARAESLPASTAESTESTVPATRRRETGPRNPTHAKSADTVASAREPQPPAIQTPPNSQIPPQPQTAPGTASGTGDQIPARPDDRAGAEPPRPQDPPVRFEELVVPAESVIGLQIENTVTSEHARIEDRVDAHVTRDVRVGSRVAIPSGTRVIGSVTQVERGGKFKERGRLGVRFHTLVMADSTRMPISTETIYRDGDAPSSAQKVGGGAVIGTILGAIVGGGKGAAIGGAAGAGAGAAATAAGERSIAILPAGTPMTVRVMSPLTVTIER